MLTILLPETEFYDEAKEEFFVAGPVQLKLEHSLVSLSKWESIYEKPFLGREPKTDQEILGYIRAMIFSPEVSENITDRMTPGDFSRIQKYIDAKMTATWFTDQAPRPGREIVTSELIYYWMISYGIPMQCENWHLNRLLTLIRICNAKNQPPKKMSKAEVARKNRELNERRKAQLGTRG